jgi:hypothetical protein
VEHPTRKHLGDLAGCDPPQLLVDVTAHRGAELICHHRAVDQRERPALGLEHLARGLAQHIHAFVFECKPLGLGRVVQVEGL